MPNLLQTGAAWLGDRLKESAGRTVSISRGGVATLTNITGIVNQHEYDIYDAEGFLTKALSFDWTFVAEDLSSFIFQNGDKITDGSDVYEVMPLGQKPGSEPLDSSGILLNVHSKKVQ